MTRNVTLHLDIFGRESLDRLVDEGSSSQSAALTTAAWYYLNDADRERPGWRAPRFRSGRPSSGGVCVAFDDKTWAALEAEALRQNVATEDLALHALMYFLADLERGRAAQRVERTLRDDE